MLLEVRTVSRKTPNDGKLEVSPATARRLLMHGPALSLQLGSDVGTAQVETMACTCAKGDAGHQHHFVRSELLRRLREGETVCVEVAETGLIEIARAHAL